MRRAHDAPQLLRVATGTLADRRYRELAHRPVHLLEVPELLARQA